ncbi:response regulator [Sphingomonas flavescens]|jgi:two-component sensor histidine kinase|uniref:response regulator n=1 Tax=Sphingomonas flavescens TaxID=3132797 RepID=UPI0028054FBF|nr:response regulator [Sphingomonas limnosediminicola]
MKSPRRILYIDDDAGTRRLVQKLLGRRGHDVVTAEGGAEGLDLATKDRFDLIAVDHYMPGMDGLATLNAINKLPAPPPVIYVTGSEESSVAVAALKAGAADYVVKSVGDDFVDLLERAFQHALDREQMRKGKEEAEQKLVAANERLAALLREVNHRVANSLQMVTTMVMMQSRVLTDPAAKAALADTERRIQAIAQVHRRLYTSGDVESVAMDEYLNAIVEELEATLSSPINPRTILLNAEPLKLKTDKAVSLGVIVTELVTNACKYAYGEGEPGEIRVRFGQASAPRPDRFMLEVEDDGCGLTDDGPRGTGLGTRLIAAMAQSLESAVEYDRAYRGCRAVLVGSV